MDSEGLGDAGLAQGAAERKEMGRRWERTPQQPGAHSPGAAILDSRCPGWCARRLEGRSQHSALQTQKTATGEHGGLQDLL